MRSLLVLFSYHHKNTEKVAKVIATVLDAEIRTPDRIVPEELQYYDLIGFGSGIYGGRHHEFLLDLADKLSPVTDKKAFLFSTCGVPARVIEGESARFEEYAMNNHLALRERLRSKGYVIVSEFSCAGHNTNSFLKLFGGLNKGRPNAADLQRAEEFAEHLK
jgi:flavodoxin